MRRYPGFGATIGLLLFGSTPLLAQGIGHTFFMRGKIVRMDAGGSVACLGKADGAQVGQILEVYHATPRHRRLVGRVQVDQIFDDHFAHFQVTDGTPQKGDWVRLKRSHS
ncbi:hypothetical protein HL653_11085 [Sphingomonas sp. AP4-R1]|uniref:hypothetical protein n=1 Tax=Sphingomonas sp. AP4-R1 TaxID=2735134 RepID=UPI001493DC54|nr:hypothetical protein [Sphingomonas sp. AP4-R1]QJU58260.1 hypothetical protein HL653_11085 [Sphingomonas sp. AP4-R1]